MTRSFSSTYGRLPSAVLIFALILQIVHADYYETLGVEKNATERQIKTAYKKLSFKYHPDRVKDVPKDEAEKRFTEIANAYEVLSDPEKRANYDKFGEAAVTKGMTQQVDPIEQFKRLMGGQGATQDTHRRQLKPGPDLPAILELELEEIYVGTQIDVEVLHRVLCPKCSGSGAKPDGMGECPKCNGKGIVLQQQQTPFGILQSQAACDRCKGSGKVITKKCSKCKGDTTILRDDPIVIFVEAGTKDGEEIVYEDMGDASAETDPGRFVLTVREAPHKRFQRRGNDLYTRVWITLEEALVGVNTTIPHLDGHAVNINRLGQVTPHGHVVKVEGEGMPIKDDISSYGQNGDLYVEYAVTFPLTLTSEQREAVQTIFPEDQKYSVDPAASSPLVTSEIEGPLHGTHEYTTTKA